MVAMQSSEAAARLDRRLAFAALAALAALPWPAWAQPDAASRRLKVGVEAALQASGLAQRLAGAFGRDTGLAIGWQTGPSGEVLARLERGELDAALTLAPALELALQSQGLIHDRRPLARTELVLVGPAPRPASRKEPARRDPVGVAGSRDAVEALTRIAAAGQRGDAGFVASGEPTGAQAIEQALWRAVGPQPVGPWLRSAGPGPTAVLDLARETGSYALVERGVWSAQAPTRARKGALAVLLEGDPQLAAVYQVMRSARARHPAGALLVSWFGGASGQRVVAGYGHGYRPAA